MDWFFDLIRKTMESEVATGMTAGAMLLGAITFIGYQLRSLPRRIVSIAERQFTVTLTVYGDDDVYHPLSLWLANQPATQKARRLNVVTRWQETQSLHDNITGQARTHKVTPGPGLHILRFQNRWFLVRKDVTQPGASDAGGRNAPSAAGARKTETLTITTHGRDPAVMQTLVNEVADVQRSRETVSVYFWAGNGYQRCTEKLKRSLSTVYLDDGLKQRVIDDVENFLGRRRWYSDRGIPWRRGYLLEGPPGTGKSTFIFALASMLEKPVYIINPSTIYDDSALLHAMNSAGAGIVVIEDADTFRVAQERSKKRAASRDVPVRDAMAGGVLGGQPQAEDESDGITLSGLLNAIDGIASAEGRILFITSNHPDALDAALLRPGRVDVRERLGLAHAPVARQMFAAFHPEADADAFIREIAAHLPLSPAAIQNLLLERDAAPESAPVVPIRQIA